MEEQPVSLLGAGGILTFTLLRRLGFNVPYETVDIRRTYGKGITYQMDSPPKYRCLIDDIVASGATVNYAAQNDLPTVCCAALSLGTKGRYREPDGGVKNTSKVVAGIGIQGDNGSPPAIFSSRYLLWKIRDPAYRSYLSPYVGDRTADALAAAKTANTELFDILYNDPPAFVRRYGNV